MKAAIILLVSLACFLCLFSDAVDSAPVPSEREETFWDKIFNIPRSVLKATGKHLNENGVKCKDGQEPVEGPDGKGTCHDNGGLNIARSAVDSVNDLLNG